MSRSLAVFLAFSFVHCHVQFGLANGRRRSATNELAEG